MVFPRAVPEEDVIGNIFHVEGIVETQNGRGNANLPAWLTAFFYGGIREVERMEQFQDKYCFIAVNKGNNFDALVKWTNHYSVINDFPRLAGARIEDRLFSASTLYPDDEFGPFFETFIKKAFDSVYTRAVIEDTFWVRKIDRDTFQLIYIFFIFITVDKTDMQNHIDDMMAGAYSAVNASRAQSAAINRLQQTFFEGF